LPKLCLHFATFSPSAIEASLSQWRSIKTATLVTVENQPCSDAGPNLAVSITAGLTAPDCLGGKRQLPLADLDRRSYSGPEPPFVLCSLGADSSGPINDRRQG